jgi:UDP-N-acetylmuramyl pentapeptide phosphotransferase/UDP-N-acetylglucosamine-1-phosphate transferase
MTDASLARERLLFLTAPEIPTALWVVIYAGAFLVFFLLAVHYASRPQGRAWPLVSAVVLMTVVIGVLGALDQPFGLGARVQPPEQIRHGVNLLLAGETNPTILAACH